jgi:hypothetical protein
LLGKPPPADTDPMWLADWEFVQAQLHLKLGREAEALSAAARAQARLHEAGPGAEKQLADVEAWLRAHAVEREASPHESNRSDDEHG